MSAQRHNLHPGQWEVTHTVAPGESLSKIAAHYRAHGWSDLADWRPIYRLTRERTGLWRDKKVPNQMENPNLIFTGDVLVIPRSRSGYRALLLRLESLFQDSLHSPSYAAEVKKQEQHFSEGLNFLSDVLTFIGTVGASAASAARSASLAKTAVGTAAREALKKKTLSAVEMGLKITEYGAKETGHEKTAQYAGYAAKGVHIADLAHGAKDFREEAQKMHLKKEYWRLLGESVGQVVDAIDAALEWTQPSKLSKGIIKLFTGTDVDAVIDEQNAAEKRCRERLSSLLRQKIAKMRQEMDLVYPPM